MAMNLDQEMEKLAQLVALRAHRKMGRKPDLRLAGSESRHEVASGLEALPRLPDLISFQAVDVSERAQKMQAIVDIANANRWRSAITHFLRLKGVPYMSDLTDPQLDDLLDRMHGHLDAAATGCSLPDCLPAS